MEAKSLEERVSKIKLTPLEFIKYVRVVPETKKISRDCYLQVLGDLNWNVTRLMKLTRHSRQTIYNHFEVLNIKRKKGSRVRY